MPETILTPAIQTIREQIVIAAHHPDRLRRPPVRPGAVEDDRYRQTLLWNIFRTFDLLPPAFWLRRLQARLHLGWLPDAPEITSGVRARPHTLTPWATVLGSEVTYPGPAR
jgi:hypothetical protein